MRISQILRISKCLVKLLLEKNKWFLFKTWQRHGYKQWHTWTLLIHVLPIKKGTATHRNNISAKMDGTAFFACLEESLKKGISRRFVVGFYTGADLSERDWAQSYTPPDRGAGRGHAGWLKLSTGGKTRTHRRTREEPLLLYFDKRRKTVFLKSLKNKSKLREEDDKITPERSLWMSSQLLQSNSIHQSARSRFID